MARKFGVGLLEALGIFLGFDFCPHSIIPITWNLEYPPWGLNIPEFLASKIESMRVPTRNYNESLYAISLTMLKWEMSPPVSGLRCKSTELKLPAPVHFIFPKLEEVQHLAFIVIWGQELTTAWARFIRPSALTILLHVLLSIS